LAIGLILTSLLAPAAARAQEAPPNLAKLVAHRESETEAERNQYTYRQTLTLEELDNRGVARGRYREVRDIIFSPERERSEELAGKPENTLANLKLTPEDFRDFRDIQPLVLTVESLWNYDTRTRGDETVDGVDCWVLQVRPRQILEGQRLFDGLIWADKKGYNIVRIEGRAVPQIRSTTSENLFPRFATVRRPVDGEYWFPALTLADDTLEFRGGRQRERLRIVYGNYKRFTVDSTFTPR
jgi:negative regulator of sigma E activity